MLRDVSVVHETRPCLELELTIAIVTASPQNTIHFDDRAIMKATSIYIHCCIHVSHAC